MENLEQDSAYIVTCAEFGLNTCKGFFGYHVGHGWGQGGEVSLDVVGLTLFSLLGLSPVQSVLPHRVAHFRGSVSRVGCVE